MTSDEKTTKINSVDLEKLLNFVIGNFLIWKHLVMQNCVWILKF